MKKLIIVSIIIGLALAGCTSTEVANFEQDLANNMREMQNMQRDCKNYITQKVDLPMAAVSVMAGYGANGRYTLPVQIKWDRPYVDEKGQCIVVNGIAREYRITD